jgi:dihydrofolate synthase / folylpolyglutamate synthase
MMRRQGEIICKWAIGPGYKADVFWATGSNRGVAADQGYRPGIHAGAGCSGSKTPVFYTYLSMSYQSAVAQLNAMVPELHASADQPRRKFSLDEIGTLLTALGNPHKAFPSVLIAGTNGKGSTAATLASILSASSLRTGLYTSPHLERPNERIRIDGIEINDESFARQYFRIENCAQRLIMDGRLAQFPSYFETLTAMAFLQFAEMGVSIAVLEVGMGGRLDATNIVDPVVSVITDISLDHMEWLGSTIAEIAREKAGILRPGGTLVTLPQLPDANRVMGEVAAELKVIGVSAAEYMPAMGAKADEPYSVEALGAPVMVASPLRGAHQQRNVALAIATAIELAVSHGFPIVAASIADGIRHTCWPGRMERMSACGADWILDVAHNPAGAWALRSGLRDVADKGQLGTLIFSCLRDKPAVEMGQILFPLFSKVIFTPIHSARATPMRDLMDAAAATQTPAIATSSVQQALEMAREKAGNKLVVVSGSVYLVGEARSYLLTKRVQESRVGEGVGKG